MPFLTRSHRSIFCLLFISTVLSCKGNDQQDDVIDANLRTRLTLLNKQVVAALANNNAEKILALSNDSIKNSNKYRFALYKLANETHEAIDTAHYFIKKQFYEIRHSPGDQVKVGPETGNEHDYHISFNSATRKAFITVGILRDSDRATAIVTIFNNYEGDWKLNYLWLAPMRVVNRDAVDWYYRARQQYASNDYADAGISIAICQDLLNPGGEIWHYELENDMSILPGQIKNAFESQFTLPMPVPAIRTTPTIVSISSANFNGAICPVVNYITKISMTDTIALSRECDSLNAHIGDLFQGLDHNNKSLLYRAYIRAPLNDEDTVLNYRFVRKSLANWY